MYFYEYPMAWKRKHLTLREKKDDMEKKKEKREKRKWSVRNISELILIIKFLLLKKYWRDKFINTIKS